MAQTIKTGLIDSADPVSNELVVDMSDKLHRLIVDQTQLTTMLMTLSKKNATREVIDWLEEEFRQRVSALAASATSAATDATVTTGEGNTVFAANDVVRNMETGEGWLVTSTSANSIGFTRSWGGTAAASSTSAAQLLILGNAYAQGASSGTVRYVQRVRSYNYVQEFREPIFFSYILEASELYHGREPGKELIRAAGNHKRGLESALFWGARDYDSSASPGPRGGMGGAVEYISTNVSSAGGATTPAELDAFLLSPLSYATDPVIFAAPLVAQVLSNMYRGIWQPNQGGVQKYGVKVDRFIDSAYGTNIPVIVKKDWIDLSQTSTNYGTWLFLLDMDKIRLRPMRDWPVGGVRRNVGEPSSTSTVHEYYSPTSLEFGIEKAHGILKGITSYSAS